MTRKHRDVIAIEREADQQVSVTIGAPTAGGREVDGGYSQLFNRVMSSGIYAELPLPARAVYTALVYLADNMNFFIVAGKDSKGVNIDRIMHVSGCGETAVKQSIRTLAERQLIRILRKGGSTPDGQRYASIYQLLLPVAGYENLHKKPAALPAPGRNATPYRGASRPGTAAQDDPVPGREASRFPSARRTDTGSSHVRSNRTARSEDSSTRAAADATDPVKEMLAARGVGEPLLSRIVQEADAQTIERHCVDFDVRNKIAGGSGQPKKTAGWLVKAILVPYELHERTLKQLADATRATQAAEHRHRKELAEAMEAERLAAIDGWAQEQFEQADDEELAALKRKVIEEYGPAVKGLDRADPRTHTKLSRLIKGMLGRMYTPGAVD